MNEWSWSLSWGEITPKILIGSCPMDPSDLREIAHSAAAEAVLCLQHDDCFGYWDIDYTEMRRKGEELDLVMKRYPIRDFSVDELREHLARAVSELNKLIETGHRTYVHCTAGIWRAPLVVYAYLVLVKGLEPEPAMRLLKQGRPQAAPSMEAFRGARSDLVERLRPGIERRAYELYELDANGDRDLDWIQAEAELLRDAILGGLP